MAKQTFSRVYELTSDAGAAGVDAEPFRTSGEAVTLQVIDAPANLIECQGSVDGNTFVNMTHAPVGAGGPVAITALGAGVYEVRERPAWMRFGVLQDVNAPRAFRAQFLVHEHD